MFIYYTSISDREIICLLTPRAASLTFMDFFERSDSKAILVASAMKLGTSTSLSSGPSISLKPLGGRGCLAVPPRSFMKIVNWGPMSGMCWKLSRTFSLLIGVEIVKIRIADF